MTECVEASGMCRGSRKQETEIKTKMTAFKARLRRRGRSGGRGHKYVDNRADLVCF